MRGFGLERVGNCAIAVLSTAWSPVGLPPTLFELWRAGLALFYLTAWGYRGRA
ncbi:MAG: hypothetical protein RI897_1751 [Verrucomicrobiota bacterium]|jgi:hypothetical protein